VIYNPEMDNDTTLEEFVQILGRIKDLIGEATIADDKGFDLVEFIEQLRESGKTDDADELSGLLKRADELKAQHEADL